VASWVDFWNADTPIYVSDRHKQLHYRRIAADMKRLLLPADRVVLDYGCGEALAAADLAAACERLYLCDAAPNTRARLAERFRDETRIAVLSPEDVAALDDDSLDLVIVNSVLQYIGKAALPGLLALFHAKLRPGGRLILADLIPPQTSALSDAGALLMFGAEGGFLLAAFGGLVRTALSDYRRVRSELGLSTFEPDEVLALLATAGFKARRLPRNIGHNQARMAFEAVPTGS